MAKFNVPLPPLTPFTGDPSHLEYFIKMIKEQGQLSSFNKDQLVFFTRANIKGQAEEFLRESEEYSNAKTFDELCEVLRNFYPPPTATLAQAELITFQMLPEENFNHLAHRLGLLVSRLYNSVDKETLSQIKFQEFIKVIPSQYRLDIQTNEIKTFDKAVARAQLLQNCHISNNVLNNIQHSFQNNGPSSSRIPEAHITNVNANTDSVNQQTSSKIFNDRNRYRNNPHKKGNLYSRQNFQFKASRQSLFCKYCKKTGHSISKCFKLKNKNQYSAQHVPQNQVLTLACLPPPNCNKVNNTHQCTAADNLNSRREL